MEKSFAFFCLLAARLNVLELDASLLAQGDFENISFSKLVVSMSI